MTPYITTDHIKDTIYTIRGQQVILDRDLAKLYQVETKVLKQAVKRNISRFPEDFMFKMSAEELQDWRSQFVTSKNDLQGLRHAPFCFTEQGVAMISSVLHNELAIQINIEIIRAFVKMRLYVNEHQELRAAITEIRQRLGKHDQSLELIFQYLDDLTQRSLDPAPRSPRKRMGYLPEDRL